MRDNLTSVTDGNSVLHDQMRIRHRTTGHVLILLTHCEYYTADNLWDGGGGKDSKQRPTPR